MTIHAPVFANSPTPKLSLHTFFDEFIIVLFLALLVTVALTSVTITLVVIQTSVLDQSTHLDFAKDMFDTGVPPIAHFLYQTLVIGLHLIINDSDWLFSAVAGNVLPQVFTCIIIYLALRSGFREVETSWKPGQRWMVRCVCAALAIGLLIAAPLFTLLTPVTGQPDQMLLGFVTPITYHNPTITLLRPFALSLYLLIGAYVFPVSAPQSRQRASVLISGLLIAVTVLCGLSKPNYLLALMPALLLWSVWAGWRKHPVGWQYLLLGVLLPTILMLGWQFVFTFVNPTRQLEASAGLAFAPFKVILYLSGDSRGIMLLRFGVSLLFPAVVYLLWWKSAKDDRALNFAGLTFIFGVIFMYFLAESGDRWLHGNFFWSAYITLFILNVASARFVLQILLRLYQQRGRLTIDWRIVFIVFLFSLHIMSGIFYIDLVNHWL